MVRHGRSLLIHSWFDISQLLVNSFIIFLIEDVNKTKKKIETERNVGVEAFTSKLANVKPIQA